MSSHESILKRIDLVNKMGKKGVIKMDRVLVGKYCPGCWLMWEIEERM